MDTIQTVFAALSGDSTLDALLAQHAGEPAIFSGDLPPPGFVIGALPMILIRPPVDEVNRDTFDSFARSVTLDVFLYAAAGASSAAIDDAANRARVVLHREYLPAPSWEVDPLATVSGPFGAPSSEASITARRLSVRLDLRE